MLFIGEQVGTKKGPKVDIAVDPLEGTVLCAKNIPGAIATMAMAEGGTLLNAPDVYMEKIAIGPGYPKGVVELDAPSEQNIRNLAKAKGVTRVQERRCAWWSASRVQTLTPSTTGSLSRIRRLSRGRTPSPFPCGKPQA